MYVNHFKGEYISKIHLFEMYANLVKNVSLKSLGIIFFKVFFFLFIFSPIQQTECDNHRQADQR